MHSHIVVGLAFGDEGKGSWVDHLCRRHNIKTVVRFNGGAQALHHVTTETGVTHGFSQFGSHSFIPGAKTLLSRFMLIEPLELMQEAVKLREKGIASPLRMLFISDEAPLIPFANILLNRIMETARGNARHGSCGLGIGLTQRDIDDGVKPVIRAADLHHPQLLREKVEEHYQLTLREVKDWHSDNALSYAQELARFDIDHYLSLLHAFASQVRIVREELFLTLLRRDAVVFEGAQGALLDQYQGTFPYCTRSTTTAANALKLLEDAVFGGDVTRHGLFRAYGTRHGAGPFVTEANVAIPLCDNSTGLWQGEFRQGWFDVVAARTALQTSPVDEVVLTNLDRLNGFSRLNIATEYRDCHPDFYDVSGRRLRAVGNYEESKVRTEMLFHTTPVYDQAPGYQDEYDTQEESYIRLLEDQIGQTITALSRRKDCHKVYR
jgi:adenylosuccinate synthase